MTYHGNVVLFVGGVGGARLAHGLYQELKPEQLTVIVNNGDDFWHYGLRICPDVDTIMYTLSGCVNKAFGWGVTDDTRNTLDTLKEYGEDTWFGLGDKDIALHLIRTGRLHTGQNLTQITQYLAQILGIKCAILPMSDDYVETIVHTQEHGALGFQEYFVKNRWQPTLTHLEFKGEQDAKISPQIAHAIDNADAIIIAPSNPWLSIQPILRVNGLRERILARDIPRIAVTPIIAGKSVKGPTDKIMAELGLEVSVMAVVEYYQDLINGFVYDERDTAFNMAGIRLTAFDTLMDHEDKRRTLARHILGWLANWSSL
jgi:LPPG:FO 2-phospho-L-lactate transferase